MMKFKIVILALITLPFISGCIITNPTDAYTHSDSSYGKKAIAVELVNATLALTVTNKTLNRAQLGQIRTFVLQQGSSYKQRILVNGSPRNLVRLLPQLSQLLIEQGIGQDKQKFQPNKALSKNKLLLTSEYFQAIAPSCHREITSDIGCANSRNLAMMIADPAQLLRAAPSAAADASKAVSAINTYRTGEAMPSSSLTDFVQGN